MSKKYKGICPNCDKKATFKYMGMQKLPKFMQKDFGGKKALTIIECDECKSSTTARQIK